MNENPTPNPLINYRLNEIRVSNEKIQFQFILSIRINYILS